MSREVRFRLRLHGKIVGYEKWYSGAWLKDEMYFRAEPCWLYSKDGDKWNPTPIKHDEKDASTGLHDKNGNEVWDGDLIRHSGAGGVVEWINDGCGWGFRRERHFMMLSHLCEKYMEVMGNIWEGQKEVGTKRTSA